MAALKLDSPSTKEVASLLGAEEFYEFESRVRRYEQKFASDPSWESPLTKLYDGIDGGNVSLKEKLDKWISTRPSYISYSARGAYEVSRGYKERGSSAIEDTSPENLTIMKASLAEAQRDSEMALAMNHKFVPAYISLLGVAQAIGGADAAAAIERRATREIPTTYYIRHSYLVTLTPSWGGSYEKMAAYASGLRDAAKLNPRIWSLNGESWAVRAYEAKLDGDALAAITYYTKALHFGDRIGILRARGNLYMVTQQYDLALKDFTRYRDFDTTNEQVNRDVICLQSMRAGRTCASTESDDHQSGA